MSELRVDVAVDDRNVEVAFTVADGETVALLGPNGAGKSTVLGVVAGLIDPSRGSVTLGERELVGVPPHQRKVALLAQEPLLFPHMSAIDNVAFGPRALGKSKVQANGIAQGWLDEVGVGELAQRKPAQLSGGQAQRVAVARSLAARPELLLLDEPMAALDVTVTPALRQSLRSVLADRTTLIVTHDVLDALLLADRVIVLEDGRIVEDAPTADVLRHPRSKFAADLAGLNFVTGEWTGEAVDHGDAAIFGLAPSNALTVGARAIAVCSPSAVAIYRDEPHGSPRNNLRVVVRDIVPYADRLRVRAAISPEVELAAEITAAGAADLDLAPGAEVYFTVKATEVSVYPAS